MMNAIRNLLGKRNQTTAALVSARDSIDLAALTRIADDIAAQRRAALLDASDDEIAKLEQKEAVARRDLDRARAAIEELDQRIARAQARETLAAWRAERAATDSAAEAAATAIRERYPALAKELAALISAAETADGAARQWNLTKANTWPDGATEEDKAYVARVETRLFEGFHEDGVSGSLIQDTRLLELGEFAPGIHDYATLHRGSILKPRSSR